jgi:hypothetical protein
MSPAATWQSHTIQGGYASVQLLRNDIVFLAYIATLRLVRDPLKTEIQLKHLRFESISLFLKIVPGMIDTLIKKIRSIDRFSESEIDFFVGNLKTFTVAKGEHALREGEVCRHLDYIESGIAMYYRMYDE